MSVKILIADDDPSIVMMMKENLSSEGYEVSEAFDGDSALANAKSLLPQLILLDMNMPGLSGRQVLETLRSSPETQSIPVIFLTGEAGGQIPEALKGLPRVGYIAKTTPLDELNSRIASFLKAGH